MQCYIVDIDGTIADLLHREKYLEERPKNWDMFFRMAGDDLPFPHMRLLLTHLVAGQSGIAPANKTYIVYVSGRPERCRFDTVTWIHRHGFPTPNTLYMRADGDYRDDSIIKKELLDQLLADGYEPIMAFDDRDRVVKMWRENGIPCAQVREGNF
jgi:hypothetical protein